MRIDAEWPRRWTFLGIGWIHVTTFLRTFAQILCGCVMTAVQFYTPSATELAFTPHNSFSGGHALKSAFALCFL